jgi:hypothetical protein
LVRAIPAQNVKLAIGTGSAGGFASSDGRSGAGGTGTLRAGGRSMTAAALFTVGAALDGVPAAAAGRGGAFAALGGRSAGLCLAEAFTAAALATFVIGFATGFADALAATFGAFFAGLAPVLEIFFGLLPAALRAGLLAPARAFLAGARDFVALAMGVHANVSRGPLSNGTDSFTC